MRELHILPKCLSFGGIWNRGRPVVVQESILIEPGLYNLFVEVHTVGTTRAHEDPVLKNDMWGDTLSRRKRQHLRRPPDSSGQHQELLGTFENS